MNLGSRISDFSRSGANLCNPRNLTVEISMSIMTTKTMTWYCDVLIKI